MVISGFLSIKFPPFLNIWSCVPFLCLPEPLRAWWGFRTVSGWASCPAGSVVPLPVFWKRGPDGEELLHGQTCLHPQPPSSASQCHPGYVVHVPRALPTISGCLTLWHPYAYTHYWYCSVLEIMVGVPHILDDGVYIYHSCYNKMLILVRC